MIGMAELVVAREAIVRIGREPGGIPAWLRSQGIDPDGLARFVRWNIAATQEFALEIDPDVLLVVGIEIGWLLRGDRTYVAATAPALEHRPAHGGHPDPGAA